MKVFLSWSGETSLAVADAFNTWLQDVMHFVKPFLSPNIPKGERWWNDIESELSTTSFGIVFVTRANVGEPWINFEAGAISNKVGKRRVSPLLIDLKSSELQGPLLQFQYGDCSKAEIEKLVSSINGEASQEFALDTELLKRSFERCWPELELKLTKIRAAQPMQTQEPESPTPEMAILEELLELSRNQMKVLKSTEKALSPDHLARALGLRSRGKEGLLLLSTYVQNMLRVLSIKSEDTSSREELLKIIHKANSLTRSVSGKYTELSLEAAIFEGQSLPSGFAEDRIRGSSLQTAGIDYESFRTSPYATAEFNDAEGSSSTGTPRAAVE